MKLRSASVILRGFFTMMCVSADRAHTPTCTGEKFRKHRHPTH